MADSRRETEINDLFTGHSTPQKVRDQVLKMQHKTSQFASAESG